MRIKKIILMALIAAILTGLGAVIWWATSPAEYGAYVSIECLKDTKSGESCVQKDITPEEERALMKGRVLTESGYFEIVGSGRDFRIIEDVIRVAEKEAGGVEREVLEKVRSEAAQCGAGAFKPTHVVPEFPGRWSAVYDLGDGRRALLTRDDFYAAGGALGSFEYLLRTKVNGNPSTTILLRQRRGTKRLWLLTWESKGVAFELSLDDKRPPNDSFAEVLGTASIIDRHCHWDRPKFKSSAPPFPPSGRNR